MAGIVPYQPSSTQVLVVAQVGSFRMLRALSCAASSQAAIVNRIGYAEPLWIAEISRLGWMHLPADRRGLYPYDTRLPPDHALHLFILAPH